MAVTYQQLYDQAIQAVVNSCYNISKWNSLPSQFKSGYSQSMSFTGSYPNESGVQVSWRLMTATFRISNPIQQFSQDTVESDFQSVLNYYGISPRLTEVPSSNGLIEFFQAFAVFCSARVNICASQFNSTRYTVYDRSAPYEYAAALSEGNLATASDADTITSACIKIIGSTAKEAWIRYTLTTQTFQ